MQYLKKYNKKPKGKINENTSSEKESLLDKFIGDSIFDGEIVDIVIDGFSEIKNNELKITLEDLIK